MAYKRVKFSRCSSQSFEETGFLGLESNTGPKTNSGLVGAMFSRFICDLNEVQSEKEQAAAGGCLE